MRVVIQRAGSAQVVVDGKVVGSIGHGLVVLLGIEVNDGEEDIAWLCNKVVALRIFNDAAGIPNLNVQEVGGDILVVSQFTLHALAKKGNRPSYIRAARPEIAEPLYEKFVKLLTTQMSRQVQCGIFGADMKLTLLNDGPITIILDTKQKDF